MVPYGRISKVDKDEKEHDTYEPSEKYIQTLAGPFIGDKET